jgi:hypothetical protein
MFNLGDDSELDHLSREAAGKFSSPGKPNWEALSEELDKVMPVEEKKRRFAFFWLLPLLLIGGGVSYWLVSKEEGSSQTVSVIHTSVPAAQIESKQNTAVVVPSAKDLNATQKEKTATSNNTPATSVNSESLSTINEKAAKPSGYITTSQNTNTHKIAARTLHAEAGKDKISVAVINPENTITNTIVTIDQQVNKNASSIISANPKTEKAEKESKINTDLPVKENQASITETKADQVQDTKPTTDLSPVTEVKEPNKTVAPKKGRGLSYAFLGGVDKSTVKFTYGNGPGYNFGVMIGYHFNDKLSIHTGAILTQKNYKLAGQDFTAPKGTPISYYKLETVAGYCRMWEIPLLMRYTFTKPQGNSFFLSAGLSSYFMTKENYEYFYYYNGVPVTKNISYNSTDTHILSILHLSAGFDKPISKNWSVQIEPYAKIPLGGVGFGNIQLSSFGINFSMQHRQPSKK